MQEVNYNYNIRGWLTAINKEVTTTADENGLVQLGSGDLFAFDISYNQLKNAVGDSQPLYNGNISETFWVTANDNVVRQYGYEYDKLNRLKKANFIKPYEATEEEGYNETINYDKNGNIMNLHRTGKVQFSTNVIDDLAYTYNGNQLIKVTDSSNSPQGFNDGANQTEEYIYDANGNLTKDLNKDIQSILYNHLNLPTQILFGNGNMITYLYNAFGIKLKKTVRTGTEYANTDYLSGFQYRSSYTEAQGDQGTAELQYFPHAEGYVKHNQGQFNYVYNYTDHLGNVRLSYTYDQENNMIKIMEENNYYPFGMKHEFYNSQIMQYNTVTVDDDPQVVLEQIANNVGDGRNMYKYNGKEFQDELGLNFYDYGERFYMPDIGRWGSVDKKAELYYGKSQYVYALNTPIQAVDPDGNLVIFINGMHTGDGGKSDYWRTFKTIRQISGTRSFMGIKWNTYKETKIETYAFDKDVMKHLNDQNAVYRDGALGGIHNLGLERRLGKTNLIANNRKHEGYLQGEIDAEVIIASLAKDDDGNIVESIKIISHSMGGAYAKGYAKALLDYASRKEIKGVVIAFEADFAPFQPDSQQAIKKTGMGDTLQFSHSDDIVAGNDPIKGAIQKDTSSDKKQGHSIFDFVNQIKNLPTGTYNINGIKVTVK